MATSKDFHDYVMDNLSRIDCFESKKMMGEYCIYYGVKVIALLCDNMFFLKPTDSALSAFPNNGRGYPYEGSKTLMIIIEDIENITALAEVIPKMYDELPFPKSRKNRNNKI